MSLPQERRRSMSRATEEEIKKQNDFCKQLADRLHCDIDNFAWDCGRDNHTRIQNDIVRLRKELNTLSKMFNWNQADIAEWLTRLNK